MVIKSLKTSALFLIAVYATYTFIGECYGGWDGRCIQFVSGGFFSYWNLVVWFIIFLIVLKRNKEKIKRARKEEEELQQAREEGIAQAREEAAKLYNFRHDPISGSYLICPVCMGGGKNAAGYTCPRCDGTGRA